MERFRCFDLTAPFVFLLHILEFHSLQNTLHDPVSSDGWVCFLCENCFNSSGA